MSGILTGKLNFRERFVVFFFFCKAGKEISLVSRCTTLAGSSVHSRKLIQADLMETSKCGFAP